ncbi:PAS domain-containing protein [Methylobacterium sp. J-088]|uniref:PAS domain-containing protein n=1 Tax=Methylobacterium sp. J-088 TaxID=2836664 RepID=UPI00391CB803
MPADRFTIDEAFATAFGLDPALGREGIPLAQIVATVHPDDQAGLAEAINEAVVRGGRYAHQYRVLRHDGQYHWLEANGHVEHGTDGMPLRFPGVLLDIEERRVVEQARERAVAALQDLNADLERQVAERSLARGRIWQVTPDLLVIINDQGWFETLNPAWTATLGWSEAELTQTAFFDFVHPDDIAPTQVAWALANERGLPVLRFQNRYRHKDGGWRWLSWVGVPDDGKVYCSARDVTVDVEQAAILRESQEREERIRQTTQRMQTSLAAGAIIGTWNWNFQDDFFTFDEGFALAFGHDRASAQTGLPIDQVLVNVHPEDRPGLDAAIKETIARGGSYARQYRVRRADGKFYWLEANGRVDFDADGTASSFPGFIMNVEDRVSLEAQRDRATAELRALSETLESRVAERTSELMQAEETLRQSQKMEAVGQLTGGLAHDFNNLLAVVSGNLELMAVRLGRGKVDDLERFMASAQAAAKRAAALTHRLLAFSRRQTLEPKVTGINELVEGLQDMVNRTAGPEIVVDFVAGADLWTAFVDPNQIENALLNLCINARDAMPDGGQLTVETSNQDLGPGIATIRDLPPGQYVALSVSDTGTGMSPELIARVFEPFFTTKPTGQGTGLGLSMVYGFARQSNGQVRIHSEVGRGTTVTIYLPRSEQSFVEDRIDLVAAPQPARRGQTVLVVDDELAVRMLIDEVLRELGYGIIEAGDGATALKILQSDTRIDLLVTDVGMPGMNGRQLADAARMSRPQLKTLFITGYAEASVISHGHLDAGMAVMTKPFALDVLANRVRAMIKAPTAIAS